METADSYIASAERALRQGHAHEALVTLHQLVSQQPCHAQGLALLAVAHAMMGEDVETRDAVARAAQIAPRDPIVRRCAYVALARLPDAERARAQLAYFAQLDPANTMAAEQLRRLGGPPPGLPPLPAAERAVVWYDGGGHALCDAGDLTDEGAEPPPGPDVMECPACEKRTFKGWVCQHCGTGLPRAV